jgi:hypothetical protein
MPFAPGDHVYQWCKVAGILKFQHHAIIMKVYWDQSNEMWMTDVCDLSQNPIDATPGRSVSRTSTIPRGVKSKGNPYSNKGEPGFWRSYSTPTADWHKVIYQALWHHFFCPPGTYTWVKCDPADVTLARAKYLQDSGAFLLAGEPYHWLYKNCEAVATWCKTGKWCTLQSFAFVVTTTVGIMHPYVTKRWAKIEKTLNDGFQENCTLKRPEGVEVTEEEVKND